MSGNKFVAGMIIGAAAGAAIGLMFAPKPGKETRHIVKDRAGKISNQAGGYIGSMREKVRGNKSYRTADALQDEAADLMITSG